MAQDCRSNQQQSNRREFIQSAAGVSAALLGTIAWCDEVSAQESGHAAPQPPQFVEPGDTILFQGDSITDAGRKRDLAAEANSFGAMGNGYAWLAAAQLLASRPEDNLKIFNRGISGNKVYQLAERWQADCLDLKPKVLSILIGVNDFWHKHKHNYDGTLEKYQADYRQLIERTQGALPKVKLVICEPFVLKIGAVDDSWFPAFDGYRTAAKHVAEQAGATFVPLQAMFDRAVTLAPPQHWAADGVHPTLYGAALMARWWLKAIGA